MLAYDDYVRMFNAGDDAAPIDRFFADASITVARAGLPENHAADGMTIG